jgi:WD40 repeat protein
MRWHNPLLPSAALAGAACLVGAALSAGLPVGPRPGAAGEVRSGPTGKPKVLGPQATLETGMKDGTLSVAVSADGKYVAAHGTDKKGGVQVWDVPQRRRLHAFDSAAISPGQIALSPDGKVLAYADYDLYAIVLRQVGSGKELRRLRPKGRGIFYFGLCMTFSPAGDRLVALMNYDIVGWNVNSGEQRFEWKGPEKVRALGGFLGGGKKLVSGTEKDTIQVRDVETGKVLQALSGGMDRLAAPVAVSPDGKRVAWGSVGPIEVWDLPTREKTREIDVRLTTWGRPVFLADSKTMACPDWQTHDIRLIDTDTGVTTHLLRGHKKNAQGLALTRDGSLIVSASDDATVKVWDLKSFR